MGVISHIIRPVEAWQNAVEVGIFVLDVRGIPEGPYMKYIGLKLTFRTVLFEVV